MKFDLIYGNNFYREKLCTFDCAYEERYATAQEKLTEAGIHCNDEKGTWEETPDGKIYYSEIIAADNAAGLFSY